MIENLILGIQCVFQLNNIIYVLFGTFFGIIFGAIPGLTATMGISLLIPFTFKLHPISGIVLLIGIYIGGVSGGLISAILLRMPGTPSSVATVFDGYTMAKKGQPGRALGIGIYSSTIAGIITTSLLVIIAPPLANIAVKFGFYEMFSLVFFSLTIVVVLSSSQLIKGLIAVCIGLLLSLFGLDPVGSTPRFTFGMDSLKGGFNLLPLLIGLFAVSKIMEEIGNTADEAKADQNVDQTGIFPPISIFIKDWINLIRSIIIGFFVGILPGIGSSTSNVLSYGQAKAFSKNPEKFGTGCAEGIIASEAANNASIAGALAPLITMGIPGDAATAILIGGLMIHGINPGPLLFHNNADLVYSIFVSSFLANIFMFVLMIFGMRLFIKILNIPKKYLLTSIMLLCVVGAYVLNNRLFDVWTLLIAGVIGFLLERFNYPLTPIILGIVLGPIMERNLREGLIAYHGSLLPIFTRPISLVFVILACVSLAFSIIMIFKKKHYENSKE